MKTYIKVLEVAARFALLASIVIALFAIAVTQRDASGEEQSQIPDWTKWDCYQEGDYASTGFLLFQNCVMENGVGLGAFFYFKGSDFTRKENVITVAWNTDDTTEVLVAINKKGKWIIGAKGQAGKIKKRSTSITFFIFNEDGSEKERLEIPIPKES